MSSREETKAQEISPLSAPPFPVPPASTPFFEFQEWLQTASHWLHKAAQAAYQPEERAKIQQYLDKDMWDALFGLIWERWNTSPTQALLKEVFGKELILLERLYDAEEARARLEGLAIKALTLNRSMKGTYYIFDVLVKRTGAKVFLDREPMLVPSSFVLMKELSLAPSVGRSIANILAQRRKEMSKEYVTAEEADAAWLNIWQEPLREFLLNSSEQTLKNFVFYLLPALFKPSSEAYRMFVKVLSKDLDSTSVRGLQALMSTLQVGKEIRLVEDLNAALLAEVGLPSNLLIDLLTHHSSSLRLSALSLITSHGHVSRPMSTEAFNLLKESLPAFFANTDADFRHIVYGNMRSLLVRLRASAHGLARESKKAKDADKRAEAEATLNNTKGFCEWLVQFVKEELRPGSSYQRVTMSLRILAAMAKSGLAADVESTLIEPSELKFPFQLPIFDETMTRLLIDRLQSAFDDARQGAIELLYMAPTPLAGLTTEEGVAKLLQKAVGLLGSTRAGEADGGARVVQVIYHIYVSKGWNLSLADASEKSYEDNNAAFVADLLNVIEGYAEAAHEDLLSAAQTKPLHGLLTALRYVLEELDYATPKVAQHKAEWLALHQRAFAVCQDIWAAVQGVLTQDAPEGNITSDVDYEPTTEIGPTTQVISSFSWRAIKEAGALLGLLLTKTPYSVAEGESWLSIDDFSVGGELFQTWLTDIRHRGAFAAVHPHFVAVCARLFASNDEQLSKLPAAWLEQNMGLIISKSQYITRRSGGLPFCITGLLSAEKNPARPLLNQTLARLLEVASQPAKVLAEGEKLDLPQVHGMNIIRAIFMESKLAIASSSLVEKAFALTITSFSSEVWAIRNCAMMLFSSLLNRAFGNKRSRDDYSTVNKRITSKTFFEKYPSLHPYILAELRKSVDLLMKTGEAKVESGLFPVLTLFAKLEITPQLHGEPRWTAMDAFKDLIMACSSSQVWKVREMSAKALPTFIEASEVTQAIVDIMARSNLSNQNALHGNLLQIKFLLETRATQLVGTEYFADFAKRVPQALYAKFVDFTANNDNSVTRGLFVELSGTHFFDLTWLKRAVAHTDADIALFLAESKALRLLAADSGDRYLYPQNKPEHFIGESLWREAQADLLMKALNYEDSKIISSRPPSGTVVRLLRHPQYEARLKTLELLESDFHSHKFAKSPDLLNAILAIIAEDSFDQVRIAALKCLLALHSHASVTQLPGDMNKVWDQFIDAVQHPTSVPAQEQSLAVAGIVLKQIWQSESAVDKKFSMLHTWINLLQEYVDEEKEYTSRIAALESLRAFSPEMVLSAKNTQATEAFLSIYIILLELLEDDDDEIRDGAAEIVSIVLGSSTVFTSHRSSVLLAERVADVHKSSSQLRDLILAHLSAYEGTVDVSEQLEKAMSVDATLFIKEKQNLWKDELRTATCWTSMLARMEVPKDNVSAWAASSLAALNSLKKEDGCLGWTSEEDVWSIGARAIIAAKLCTLNNDLASIKKTAEELNWHNLWREQMTLQ
ncbi:hypothetical protein YB2330_001428 [Saitoella coloradoensis]